MKKLSSKIYFIIIMAFLYLPIFYLIAYSFNDGKTSVWKGFTFKWYEALFNDANLPQPTILPTFFRESRYPVEEDEKDHQHIQLHFLVELYTLEE